MANRDYKAFIVEGEAREPLIIDNISKVFFTKGNFKVIRVSRRLLRYKALEDMCKAQK